MYVNNVYKERDHLQPKGCRLSSRCSAAIMVLIPWRKYPSPVDYIKLQIHQIWELSEDPMAVHFVHEVAKI